MKLEQIIKASIKEVFVFWSESSHINSQLGDVASDDINKAISIVDFEKLASEASQFIEAGYDKTKVEVRFNDGTTLVTRLDITSTHYSLVEEIKYYLEK